MNVRIEVRKSSFGKADWTKLPIFRHSCGVTVAPETACIPGVDGKASVDLLDARRYRAFRRSGDVGAKGSRGSIDRIGIGDSPVAATPPILQAAGLSASLSAFVTCELLNACLMSPDLAISLRIAGMALAIFAALPIGRISTAAL